MIDFMALILLTLSAVLYILSKKGRKLDNKIIELQRQHIDKLIESLELRDKIIDDLIMRVKLNMANGRRG